MRYDILLNDSQHLCRKLGRLLLVLCLVMLLGSLSSRPVCADMQPVRNAVVDISLQLTLFSDNGKISAREPLLARLDMVNETDEEIILPVGTTIGTTTQWVIRDSKGDVVASTPGPTTPHGDECFSVLKLAPRATRSKIWVVSGLYRFEKAGRYTVTVQQLAGDENTIVAEDTAALDVLPFDADRLDAKCREIFTPIRTGNSHSIGIPMGIRTKALYSVRDDIVLPYLEWLVKKMDAKYAAYAILHIDTDHAREVFKQLASRKDKAGEETRNALKLPESISKDVIWNMRD